MVQRMLVLCDREEDYAQQLAAFLEGGRDFPWEVTVYTNKEEMMQFLEEVSADIVLLAESLIGEYPVQLSVGQIVLLNESGIIRFPELKNIDKYQDAENVRRELLKLYAGQEVTEYPVLQNEKDTQIIGFYSPVKRCLQTSLAITCGNLLALRGRVLFLSFEYYGSLKELEAETSETDMTALLYYLGAEQQKFSLHLKAMVRTMGNWDYISPMRNSENMPAVIMEDWLKLLHRCRTCGEYDFIILDLNEGIQGMFALLQQCNLIFTVTKEDKFSRYKLKKYDDLLCGKGYEGIRDKTVRLSVPAIRQLPELLEDYARGELAEYMGEQLGIHYEL